MKNLLLGIGLSSLTALAMAGEKVDRTIDAYGAGNVSIEHFNGHAKITGWDKDEVRVAGELGDRTNEFIFERDGKDVIIQVKVESNNDWENWGSEDDDNLEVFVPKNSRIDYSATNAHIEISDVYGGANVATVKGDIEAENLKAQVRLETVNGDIDSRKISGKVNIETVDGDITDRSEDIEVGNYNSGSGSIEVYTKSKIVFVETVNGDIEIHLELVENLKLATVNGSIDASMDLDKNSKVSASSVGGSILLNFDEDVPALFKIETHAGGSITNKLSSHRVKKGMYSPSKLLQFSVNGGGAMVNVSTVSGLVRLEKR